MQSRINPWTFIFTFDNGSEFSIDVDCYTPAMQLGTLNPTVKTIQIFTRTYSTGEAKHFRTLQRNEQTKRFEDVEF